MNHDSGRDLSTTYCGLELRSPIMVGSCPATLASERVREMTIAGAGAIVLPSLFEEQVVADMESNGQALSEAEEGLDAQFRLARHNDYNYGLEEYLRTISRLKRQVGIPVFASLDGCTTGRWLSIGARLQSAGADAIEVRFDSPCIHPAESADQSESLMIEMVTQLCDEITIPVAVKLSPFHSCLANLCWRLAESGASAVVCFGGEPNWKVRIDEITTCPTWNLTQGGCVNQTVSGLVRANHCTSPLTFAASGGVTSTEDCIKVLLAGADVAMITSEYYRSGPDAIAHIVEGMSHFLARKQFSSLQDMLSHRAKPSVDRYSEIQYLVRSNS